MKWILLLLLICPPAFAQCTLQPLQSDPYISMYEGGVMRTLQYRITCEQTTQAHVSIEGHRRLTLQGTQNYMHVDVSIDGMPVNEPYPIEAGPNGTVFEIQLFIPGEGYRFHADQYKGDMIVTIIY